MEDFEKFYNIALRFLSYRPRTEKEVRDYLIRHFGKDSERKRGGRLQNLLATEKNERDSGHGQNDDVVCSNLKQNWGNLRIVTLKSETVS